MSFDSWEDRDLKGLVGRTIAAVRVDPSSEQVEFDTDQGTQKYFANGDCCSKSWIEHVGDAAAVIGSPVLTVTENDMGDEPDAHDRDCEAKDKPRAAERDYDAPTPQCWCDSIKVYQYVIQTAKGQLALEMRNSSNGYYGGTLDRVE